LRVKKYSRKNDRIMVTVTRLRKKRESKPLEKKLSFFPLTEIIIIANVSGKNLVSFSFAQKVRRNSFSVVSLRHHFLRKEKTPVCLLFIRKHLN